MRTLIISQPQSDELGVNLARLSCWLYKDGLGGVEWDANGPKEGNLYCFQSDDAHGLNYAIARFGPDGWEFLNYLQSDELLGVVAELLTTGKGHYGGLQSLTGNIQRHADLIAVRLGVPVELVRGFS